MREAPQYVIDIQGVSKSFRRATTRSAGYTTLKSSALAAVLKRLRTGARCAANPFYAVKDLTLRIPKGASCGIIGQNGSGKSSLLKLISGIYRPDCGSICISGRIAALIELGAGFHPDFSGRENLYLSGVMHGLTKAQIDERFDDIVHFAELQRVIDDPVRTYSSGMFMRLGFSLAVHTDPDILLIDEVLAVGDAAFVVKCQAKISELKRQGKTLLLVTHDLAAVERWCDEALWLHEGQSKDRGDPRRVIDHYREFVERGEERELEQQNQRDELLASEFSAPGHAAAEASDDSRSRWGSREIEITAVALRKLPSGEPHLVFHPDDALAVEIHYVVHDRKALESGSIVFGVCVTRRDGIVVHGTNTDIESVKLPDLGEVGVVSYEFSRIGLLDGSYSLDVAVHRKDGYPYDYHKHALTFSVRWPHAQLGVYLPEHRWRAQAGHKGIDEKPKTVKSVGYA